jgi:hypothetical protein
LSLGIAKKNLIRQIQSNRPGWWGGAGGGECGNTSYHKHIMEKSNYEEIK